MYNEIGVAVVPERFDSGGGDFDSILFDSSKTLR